VTSFTLRQAPPMPAHVLRPSEAHAEIFLNPYHGLGLLRRFPLPQRSVDAILQDVRPQ